VPRLAFWWPVVLAFHAAALGLPESAQSKSKGASTKYLARDAEHGRPGRLAYLVRRKANLSACEPSHLHRIFNHSRWCDDGGLIVVEAIAARGVCWRVVRVGLLRSFRFFRDHVERAHACGIECPVRLCSPLDRRRTFSAVSSFFVVLNLLADEGRAPASGGRSR
jgi:hypothetical protein